MPNWRDHLRDDEKPYAAEDDRSTDPMHVILVRLAHLRALYENLIEKHLERERLTTPIEWTDSMREKFNLFMHEGEEDLRLISECEDRGGCQWVPYTDEVAVRFYNGFPAEVCTHCRCSKQYTPALPTP